MPLMLAAFNKLAALLFSASALLAAAATPTVDKVEPPNWWLHHTLNPIQILIHGSGLQGASLKAPKCLGASNVHANATGTYLFADLSIAKGCKAGDYPLDITTASGTISAPFRLDEPLSLEGRFQGFSSNDVIYLIMPDRFVNGDKSNDDPPVSHGLFDPASPRLYHGGDLQGIMDRLPYLKALGITAIWITPVYENSNIQAATADYHGYGATDYYAVEEHFGDLTLLKKLVDAAHGMGLKVIQDQVANHVGPSHPWVKDPPNPNWFHGTTAHHINETWQVWDLPDAHSTDQMKHNVTDGWFADILPDLNQEDAEVARYEIQNALWWIGVAGFDGIRQDTLPYVPRAFWHDWSAAIHRQYPKLRMVGEVFVGDPPIPSYFQGGAAHDGIDTGVDSVFDFPTYFAIRDVFAHGKDMDALPKVLAQDRLYPNPNILVPFAGNHDVMRFMSEPGATAESLKLAFTYLLTTRGTPEIYYGDEIGMTGGEDPDNRHDFPTGDHADNDIFRYVQRLLHLRAELEPLRRGKLTSLAVDTKTWVYARDTVLVALNNSAVPVDLNIEFADGSYTPQLNSVDPLEIKNGKGRIHLAAKSAEIFNRTSRK